MACPVVVLRRDISRKVLSHVNMVSDIFLIFDFGHFRRNNLTSNLWIVIKFLQSIGERCTLTIEERFQVSSIFRGINLVHFR